MLSELRNRNPEQSEGAAALCGELQWHRGTKYSMSAAGAFLLTWSCYGHWLPGREGYVTRKQNRFNAPLPECDRALERRAIQHMRQQPYLLAEDSRQVVLAAIVEICSLKGWLLSAAHVRTNHVHVVATANCPPERLMVALKAYCTHKLNVQEGATGRRRWARHGSTRYLWSDVTIRAAIDYVIHQQGEPMAVFLGGGGPLFGIESKHI